MAKAKNPYLKNPFNYTGGKHKLLPQILPLFPQDIDFFIDLFAGGGDVFLNVNAKEIVANDICYPLMAMHNKFLFTDTEEILNKIKEYIGLYSLSKDGVNSKENYAKFRDDWNYTSIDDPIAFYTLLCYAFNNQIRFNKAGEYNMPSGSGRSHFNPSLEKKLIAYCARIKEINIQFCSKDFTYIDVDNFTRSPDKDSVRGLGSNDFIYADPPYLLSTATYNENGGWDIEKDKFLLEYLEKAHEKGVRFALSNLLETKGKHHPLLDEWMKRNTFTCHYLDTSYKNVSYHRDDTQKDVEILITNY